jgi:hypothetical protein
LRKKILDLVDRSAFMIEDPFDYTYNPAKNITLPKTNHAEIDYIEKFRYMSNRLKMKGTFGVELMEKLK